MIIKRFAKRNYILSALPASSQVDNFSFASFIPDFVRLLAFIILITALANPYRTEIKERKVYEGINIVLAIDISGSMLADDFKPNRLAVAKRTATEFILNRKYDRIGLLAFAGEAFVVSDLSYNFKSIIEKTNRLEPGLIKDGTSLGVGLGTALTMFRTDSTQKNVVVLITDGMNNSGFIDPLMASSLAVESNIKVYTIGIGSSGKFLIPENADGSGKKVEAELLLDSLTLKTISSQTGGEFFFAGNLTSLENIYKSISRLETNKYRIVRDVELLEFRFVLLLTSLILLILEILFRLKIFPTIER